MLNDEWPLAKEDRVESAKLRESARNEQCTLRYPQRYPTDGCYGVDTTVLSHWNGGGMATKHSDEKSAYGCFRCHTIYDEPRSALNYMEDAMRDTGSASLMECLTKLYLEWRFLRGHFETLDRFRAKGLVEWK